MTNLIEDQQKANELRKRGDFEEALSIYKDLWSKRGNQYDGAGLLHCLRKLELFDEAIVLADELIVKYPDFQWCQLEVIWTYINGMLNKLEDDAPLEIVVPIAQKIMALNPKDLAAKLTVFKVLKSAKKSVDWKTINEWVVKLNPQSLNTEPMTDRLGREGWSDRSLWYNYRIKGLVEKGEQNEAITLVDEISGLYPKQEKFFLRLKALAYYQLGNLLESENVYQNLCSSHNCDWWLFHEYAKVVRDLGKSEVALKLMYQAASRNSKLELMVSLFEDIGMLCKEMGKNEEARIHLILCNNVRHEQNWSINESALSNINELNGIIGNSDEPNSLKEALNICRSYWKILVDDERTPKGRLKDKRKIRKDILGKISFGRSDQPFCFITVEGEESIFCYKSDLPHDVGNGDEILFDAIPSFDKKKNKQSWKASNIQNI